MKEYKVKAFGCKRPERWYEDCLNINMPYFIPETIEEEVEVLGMMDSFPRYWIRSKDVPQEVIDKHPELVGYNLAIRFEDSEVTDPEGKTKRLYRNRQWVEVDEYGEWATDERTKWLMDITDKSIKKSEEIMERHSKMTMEEM